MNDVLVEIPDPRAHKDGTIAVLKLLADMTGGAASLASVMAFVDHAIELPASGIRREDNSLKYDAYVTRGPQGLRWGLTVNDRYEGDATLTRFWEMLGTLGADYPFSLADEIWRAVGRPGVSRTLACGFDEPGRPPRLKVYMQEERWGEGVATAREIAALLAKVAPAVRLPAFVEPGRRAGVVTVDLLPENAFRMKVYFGGATASAAAEHAPKDVVAMADTMARASPLSPAWHYMTIRLEPGGAPRFAINKIYDHVRLGFTRGARDLPRAWDDVRGLFAAAGNDAFLRSILERLDGLPEIRIVPTATALEDEGRSADVYFAGWRVGIGRTPETEPRIDGQGKRQGL